MEHFFWAYVAPQYTTEDGSEVIFKHADLAGVINRNNLMRDQWAGDRRTGPWFYSLGMDNATTTPGTPPRARDGGETPDAVSIDARLATLRLDERRRIRINS